MLHKSDEKIGNQCEGKLGFLLEEKNVFYCAMSFNGVGLAVATFRGRASPRSNPKHGT